MIRESAAASGAFADASGVVKEALTAGPLPQLPRDSALEIEAVVLPALTRAVAILREKAPEEVEAYRVGGAGGGRPGGRRASRRNAGGGGGGREDQGRAGRAGLSAPVDQSARTLARTQRSRTRPQAQR